MNIEGRVNTNGLFYNSQIIAVQVKIVEYVTAMPQTNLIYYIGENLNGMNVILLDFKFTSKSLSSVYEVITIHRRFDNGSVALVP